MDTELLINKLVKEGARQPLPHPFQQALFWLGGTIAYLTVLSGYSGLRSEIMDRLGDPIYALELALLIGMALSATLAALCLSRPDSYQKPVVKYVPFVFLALWVLAALAVADGLSWDTILHTMTLGQFDCVWHILLFSVPPAAAIFMIVRKGATIQTAWAGSMATLAVTSFAYLCMRLIEQNDNPAHLVVWHALPIVLLCVLGMLAGMYLLRWR